MTSPAPRTERDTQNRVVRLFTRAQTEGGLGYEYLGNWQQHANNRCIETERLRANLGARGYSPAQINAALHKLEMAAEIAGRTPYQANFQVWQLLRYGVQVQTGVGQAHETVWLIDWDAPQRNHFALAEEVTLKGHHSRRPDIVLYVNGLATLIMELKRSSVEIGDGIRQLVSNQDTPFHPQFFTTVQLLLAGSDAQGLHYGTTGTPEQFFTQWKIPGAAPEYTVGSVLDPPLAYLCEPERLLEIIRNFVLFDAGRKKLPRPHQYHAIKAAQVRLAQREGGVIWHTQGSGKSIVMVYLTRWLLEHDPRARILVVTDRDELDRQIETVMRNSRLIAEDAPAPRITTRAGLVQRLGTPAPRLLCALIHKFDSTDLTGVLPPVHGRFYVLVDECHRSQSGKFHLQMKRWLANAIFIGFTGTPLLRRDRQTTRAVFGSYIHTYKFHQAVADKVVLDLKYEARDVPQRLTSQTAIDQWFEYKTRGLNAFQKAVLRKRWATLDTLMSAKERKERIVADIIEDFSLKPRLANDRGTAMLVVNEIFDACHYFRLFHNTPFAPFVGIITSYEPNHTAISTAPAKGDERYKYETYRQFVLPDGSSAQQYEQVVKTRFIEHPAQMKLLIVVSKLLTGFDAPSCSYIYLDKRLRDHTLFQAICRTNRLDGDDKDYGHIVDYERQFQEVQQVIAIYNADELDDEAGMEDENNIHVHHWLDEGKKQLDAAHEALHYLCEPVALPRDLEQYLHYFCGHAQDPHALEQTEALRIAFYQSVATFLRAFAHLATHLGDAGYADNEAERLRQDAEFYALVRSAIKHYSGEELDIKPFEADMRHLINTYTQADPAQILGELDTLPLTELIVKSGIHEAIAQKLNAKDRLSNNAIAETIINNVRKTIIRDRLTDPRFYAHM